MFDVLTIAWPEVGIVVGWKCFHWLVQVWFL